MLPPSTDLRGWMFLQPVDFDVYIIFAGVVCFHIIPNSSKCGIIWRGFILLQAIVWTPVGCGSPRSPAASHHHYHHIAAWVRQNSQPSPWRPCRPSPWEDHWSEYQHLWQYCQDQTTSSHTSMFLVWASKGWGMKSPAPWPQSSDLKIEPFVCSLCQRSVGGHHKYHEVWHDSSKIYL